MLNREWLYTAVTRAKKRVLILTNPISRRGLQMAINVQRIRGNSLAEKAESFMELLDKKDTSLPILAEPEEVQLPEKIEMPVLTQLPPEELPKKEVNRYGFNFKL